MSNSLSLLNSLRDWAFLSTEILSVSSLFLPGESFEDLPPLERVFGEELFL